MLLRGVMFQNEKSVQKVHDHITSNASLIDGFLIAENHSSEIVPKAGILTMDLKPSLNGKYQFGLLRLI